MLNIYARNRLVSLDATNDAPALLLEGSWPHALRTSRRWSLDDAIEQRDAWIDLEAAWLTEEVVRSCRDQFGTMALEPISTAYLNVLPLRYFLVKLLRVVAFATHHEAAAFDGEMSLHAERGRDEVYAEILDAICRPRGCVLNVVWRESCAIADRDQSQDSPLPSNPPWRRLGGMFNRLTQVPTNGARSARAVGEPPRVVLWGDATHLSPLCGELRRRGCRVWWLFDRFAVKSFLRNFPRGVGQLTCESSRAPARDVAALILSGPIECRGVDLRPAVERWLAERAALHGSRETRMVEQIAAHFRRVRPTLVVVDEDATPLPRAAIAMARHMGARSYVVQHGAPCVRFGFAPLVADGLFAWGETSRRQLVRWGLDARRIHVAGAPRHDRLRDFWRRQKVRPFDHQRPRILLLATVPPADNRPDAVTYHLTRRAHDEMVEAALASVMKLAGATLVVKLHPRTRDPAAIEKLLSRPTRLSVRVARRGRLERLLAECDCVLSCGSSGGVEALLAGLPVIQLLPAGSADLLAASEWGFMGTARSEVELDRLLPIALAQRARASVAPNPDVFGSLNDAAHQRIVEHLLDEARMPDATAHDDNLRNRLHTLSAS